MELQRKIRAIANKINPSTGKSTPPQQNAGSNQGIATLLVMLAVLMIIVMFCCFAAPGVRNLCKRYIFRPCNYNDPETDVCSRGYGMYGFDVISENEKIRKLERQDPSQPPPQ